MKAVILAGGLGTRLKPFTYVVNKHLTLIYDRPQIMWLYDQLKDFDIGVVTGSGGEQIKELFTKLGISDKVTWIEQGTSYDDNTKGLAYAVSCTEKFADGEPVLIVLGDQFSPTIDLKGYFNSFISNTEDLRIMLKWNDEVSKHTAIEIGAEKITKIIEKPPLLKSGHTMIGYYCISPKIFPILKNVGFNENTGQMEFSDAVKKLWQDGGRLSYEITTKKWFDCGDPDSVVGASKYAQKLVKGDTEMKYLKEWL